MDSAKLITKRCERKHVCEVNYQKNQQHALNPSKCVPPSNNTCHFCCYENQCNSEEIPQNNRKYLNQIKSRFQKAFDRQ